MDNTLIARSEALLLNIEVDALIVFDEENIFYKEYLPFDEIAKIDMS